MSDLHDPRVFFAAERTLLAWNRTALTLMAFGFVIERFGLFAGLLEAGEAPALSGIASLWIGIAFIVLGAAVSIASVLHYRNILASLKPVEIPDGYHVNLGVYTNVAVAVLGIVLTLYLARGA
jgi:putative membrane protein